MIKIPFDLGAILAPKIERNMKKHSPKSHKKMIVKKATFLAQFGVFCGKIIGIRDILGSFWVPASISFLCFSGLPFLVGFLSICYEKREKYQKSESGFHIVKTMLS